MILNFTEYFSRKFSENNRESYEFAEIELKDEEDYCLNEIIDETIDEKILYLIKCSKIKWDFLNELHELDYGRTMAFDGITRANKRAFKMKNCELTKIGAKGCQIGFVEFESKEDWMMKNNLFFNVNINVENFVKLGMSIGTSKNENFNFKTYSSYRFTKYGKASLKFSEYLEPTEEFIKAVEGAIKSKEPENFKQITEEFGQFIPTEVILGGRAHFDDFKTSTGHYAENSKEISASIDTAVLKNKVASSSNYSKGKSNYYNSKCTKLFGGEQPTSLEKFDEEAWVKCLEDYKSWDCIEFQNPISIFQLLPDNLRKQIIKSVGKRIHYFNCEDFVYQLEEFEGPKIFELKNIPLNILKIIQNKEADCNIFATVIDTTESKKSRNGFFNCQVLYPPNGKPSLLIHCIQKSFKKRECRLKIGWMVIGYYTDFNFILSDFNTQLNILESDFNMLNNQTMSSIELLKYDYNSFIKNPLCLGIPVLSDLNSSNYSIVIGHHFFNAQEENKIGACASSYCLKNNHHVNLPNFTFCTLIISDYPIAKACNTIPFECRKKPINLINTTTEFCLNPKFISLYFTKKANRELIFLKQKGKQIKIKSINCSCSICTNRTLKISDNDFKYIKCALFDPDIRYLLSLTF